MMLSKSKFVCSILFVIIIIANSCDAPKKGGWLPTEKEAFLETCTAEAKKGIGEEKAGPYCNCMLGKMQSAYPDAAKVDKITMSETMEMARGCIQ